MTRLVLLGASGFVGSAVLRQLQGRHLATTALVHHRMPAKVPPGVQLVQGEVTALPPGLLPTAPHVVVHCASRQIDTDGSGFAVNLQGVEHLCGQVNAHTRGVLFLSSCSVYGEGPQRGVREDAPLRPGTALARSRAACERRLASLAATHGCRVEVFRPRFVLGEGDLHVLPGLARLMRRGYLLGDGRQRFSVIDVDDLARILLERAEQLLAPGAESGFAAFNVGYERPVSLLDIQQALRDSLSLPPTRHRIPVNESLLRVLSRVPVAPLRRLAHRLQLMGLDHHGDVGQLRSRLRAPWLSQDPLPALRRAAQRLAPFPEKPLEGTPA